MWGRGLEQEALVKVHSQPEVTPREEVREIFSFLSLITAFSPSDFLLGTPTG